MGPQAGPEGQKTLGDTDSTAVGNRQFDRSRRPTSRDRRGLRDMANVARQASMEHSQEAWYATLGRHRAVGAGSEVIAMDCAGECRGDGMPHEWRRDDIRISTDRDRLDLDVIHGFLVRSVLGGGPYA